MLDQFHDCDFSLNLMKQNTRCIKYRITMDQQIMLLLEVQYITMNS